MDILWSSEETDDAWPVIILADGRTLGDDGEGWREVNVPTLTELARRLLAERAEQERLDDHNDKAEAGAAEVPDLQDRLDHLESNIRSAAEAIGRNVQSDGELRGRIARLEITKEGLDRRLTELDENLAHQTGKLSLLARRVLLNSMAETVSRKAPPPALPAGGLRWDSKQGIMVDDRDRIALDLSDYFEAGNMSQKDHALLEKLADLWCAWGDRGYLRERLTSTGGSAAFRQLRSELLAVPWLFERGAGA